MGSSSSSPINPDGHYIGLNSCSSSFVLVNESSPPSKYVVQNIGRTSIIAEVCDNLKEVKELGKVLCGETKVFDVNSYLKLINAEEKKAIVHCRGGNLVLPVFSSLENNIYALSNIAIVLVKCFAPPIFTSLALLLQDLFITFWPVEKPNVWEEIADKIYNLIDENTKAIIKAFLENEIKVYKDKIKALIDESKADIGISQHYMAIAYDFVGLERKFQFSSTINNHEIINLSVLPLLVCLVSLKMSFYMIGIKFSKAIGLTSNDILQIQKYSCDTYEHAFSYLNNLEKSAVSHVYNNYDPEDMFNQIMTVRTYLGIHGLEYLPIWKFQLENTKGKEEIYNPVISYSVYVGKKTPDLYSLAISEEVPPPLCPKLIEGKRNELKIVEIYLSENFIFGAKLYFENGEEYILGTRTSSTSKLDLNGRKIIKITAYGEGKIDGLRFSFSDNIEKILGQTKSQDCKEFVLKDHYIPSFYLSSDSINLGGQAANIAVSFQWYMSPKTC